jgi:arginase
MIDQPILTPYFLDEREAEMAELPKVLGDALPGGEWRVLKIDLPEGETTYRMGALYRALADEVRAAVDAGHRPVSIAGDCCATIGVLAGLQHAGLEPTLIWFDAHGDFNTWETTSKRLSGGYAAGNGGRPGRAIAIGRCRAATVAGKQGHID